MIEEKYFQPYYVALTNGKELQVLEDYDSPWENGLIETFNRASDNEILTVSIGMVGNCAYIPKKNILFIYEDCVISARSLFDTVPPPEENVHDNPCT